MVTALPVPEPVERRTRRFVERRATLDAVAGWLAEPAGARPWFLLVGGPGSGKSALLAWLAGAGPPPSEPAARSTRDAVTEAIHAAHFCDADGGRASPSLDPLAFAQGLANQLADRFPAYGGELLQRAAGARINVTMRAGQVERMVGPTFGDIHLQSAASRFNLVLEALVAAVPGPHVVLVDALDEGELWRDEPRIAELLRSVSPWVVDAGVRFLVSSRPVSSVLDAFPAAARWDLDEMADADVATYVRARLGELAVDGDLPDRIVAAAAGNFLCAELLVDYVHEHPAEAADLAAELGEPAAGAGGTGAGGTVWKALDGAYARFLRREFGADATSADWTKGARPLLGTVAVARERLAAPKLRWLLDPDPDPLQADLVERTLPRCLQYLDGPLPDGPFGLYHFSFREFLFSPARATKFATDEWVWHRLVTDRFCAAYEADWDGFHDDYGLRHLVGHLADAARLAPAEKRGELVRRLVGLSLSDRFLAAHDRDVDDPVALMADLDQMVDAASLHLGADAPVLLVRAALGTAARRRAVARPAAVFDLAAAGDLAGAERRLGLFGLEDHWRQAALLLGAWLAPAPAHAVAAAICDRVAAEPLLPPLPDLLERVRAGLEARPPAPTGSLPPAAPREVSEYVLGALKGIDPHLDPSMLEYLEARGLRRAEAFADAEQLADVESLAAGDAGPQLRAEREAPILVAYAAAEPGDGTPLVREYLTMHAANSYVLYRNRSLWAILRSVVAHPDDGWVRDRAREIVAGALAGAMPGFRQSLPLTVLALRARAGEVDAEHEWQAILGRSKSEAEQIAAARGADGWAHLKRRLAVLAEIDARVFGGASAALIQVDATRVRSAFAGFHAPACLTLAESMRVAGAPWESIEACLADARNSAHRVQDPVFCARTTARVNAMVARWWGPLDALGARFDPVAAAAGLAANPRQAAYSPVHVVGEDYAQRPRSAEMIALAEYFLEADNLYSLAELVYQRPEPEFARLNRAVAAGEPLAPGTEVAVPDAGFAALLAARIAAELVARDDLDPLPRRHALQRLVPVAVHDQTALDTVLSRLLLVDPAASGAWVAELAPLVGEPALGGPESPDPEGGDPRATQRFGPA